MSLIIAIVGVAMCIVGLVYVHTKEEWYKLTKPPKGFIQHKGFNIKTLK